MNSTLLNKIDDSIRTRKLVRLERRVEDGFVKGYVLGVGPEFILVAVVSEAIQFDGFQCFRIKDIKRIESPSRHAGFIEKSLEMFGEERPRKPRVSLQSLDELLRTAANSFGLIALHREIKAPDVCHVGYPVDITLDCVELVEIDADAIWDSDPHAYRLKEVTRVDFGGRYERALILVGGNFRAQMK